MDFVREAIAQNRHWVSGVIEFPRFSGVLVERRVFRRAWELAGSKFITILRGLRRVGKSVLARQLALKWAGAGGGVAQVAWFEFDRDMGASSADLHSLLNFFEARGCRFIVLDEVAFVPAWQDVLKRHYDRTDLKFVVTGSSAVELDWRSSESLAGRFEIVELKPFSLSERLEFKSIKPPQNAFEEAGMAEVLEAECAEYLDFGGLPEISGQEEQQKRFSYASQSLLNPLFYKDFPAVFPRANPDLLRKALELLAATAGSTYQTQPIAQVLGCTQAEAATQIGLLEKTLLVRTAYNFTSSVVRQKRTAKKIVFADTGVLKALKPDAPLSVLAENAAIDFLDAGFFWRDSMGHEVDAVIPGQKLAVEVKYSNNVVSNDERNLRYFLERRSGWKGILVTKNDWDEKAELPRVPLWKILLGTRL